MKIVFYFIIVLGISGCNESSSDFLFDDNDNKQPNKFIFELEEHTTSLCNARVKVSSINTKQKNLYELTAVFSIGVRYYDNKTGTCDNEELKKIVIDFINTKLGENDKLIVTVFEPISW